MRGRRGGKADADERERALRLLRGRLREADQAIAAPDDLLDHLREPRPQPRAPARWRGWLTPATVTACLVVAAICASFFAGVLFQQRRSPAPAAPYSGSGTTIVVYNAEKACQSLRTIECGLSIVQNPHAAYTAANIIARVWHGDRLWADCVISDGAKVSDEAGVSSPRWYHVALPDGTIGWLAGVRTRNTTEVPRCP
jgi:hypothetical protein